MGYRDDVINFPDFKIYKVNKYLFINLINERTIKKYDDVNLNDKYILKKILNGVFNNIVQGDNNNITDETKYTNKISMVLNNKLTTFYDFYTTDINVIKKIAEILIENMILNIKAQSVLKDHLRSTNIKFIMSDLIKNKKINLPKTINDFKSRRNLINQLKIDGNLMDFRDKYVDLFNNLELKETIFKVDVKIDDSCFFKVNNDDEIKKIDELYLLPKTYGFLRHLGVSEDDFNFKKILLVSNPVVTYFYDNQQKKMFSKIDGEIDCNQIIANSSESFLKISIDFRYLTKKNSELIYEFNDYTLFLSKPAAIGLNLN